LSGHGSYSRGELADEIPEAIVVANLFAKEMRKKMSDFAAMAV
jgi:hypothetical protein